MTITSMVMAAAILTLAVNAFRQNRSSGRFRAAEARMRMLQGTILHLDEVLTMSARMAAFTDDLRWEKRYHEHEPILDGAIKEAMDLAPGAREASRRTDKANLMLVGMEKLSFDLDHRDRRGEARDVLFSTEYERQKKIYAAGMADFLGVLQQDADAMGRRQEARESRTLGLAALVLSLLMVMVLLVGRLVRRWGSGLEDFYRQIIDTDPNLVFVKDWDGRFVVANRGLEVVYGVASGGLVGKCDGDFNPRHEEVERFLKDDRAAMTKGVTQVIPEEAVTNVKTGETRWYHTIKVPFPDPEGKRRILGVATDITERRKIEFQVQRTQRIESIGTLAGGIAHDLNNVLGPVLMMVPMLKREVKDEAVREMLEMVEASVKRGIEMVRQVLAFSKGAKGEKIVLNAWSLVREMEKILKATFPKSIEVKVSLGELWPLLGDATQVHQVLLNLCVNARDAMPSGGAISISGENVEMGDDAARKHIEARPGCYVLLKVADTGTGMPPDVISKIFDPFFTTKEPGKGTGIGLSTVAAIMKGHGGFLNVYSEVGRGTQFALYFPAAEGAAGAVPVEAASPEGHGELILVADDEMAIREITKATLQSHGYRVITAADGAEAVSLYAENRGGFDAVLMDVQMPVMDGPQATHALRRINPRVRVVSTSGLKAGRAIDSPGSMAFLAKPYGAEELLKTLHGVLSGEAGAGWSEN